MCAQTNKYGLSRDIPAQVKRLVRQNSKFGCVICRSAIYTYEHIIPTWAEASSHDPDAICLLCPTHQTLSSKGRIPKDVIKAAYRKIRESEEPESIHDNEFFNLYAQQATIRLGSCSFKGFESIINVNGTNVLSYKATDGIPPYKIDGIFYDDNGKELFRIEDNEWLGPTDVWDIEQVAQRLTIRKDKKTIAFQGEKNNEVNTIAIQRLDMVFPPFHVLLDTKGLFVGQYTLGGEHSVYFHFDDWSFEYGKCAIYLNSETIEEPKPTGVKIVGGHGAFLTGTGISIGRGAIRILGAGRVGVMNNGCEIVLDRSLTKKVIPSSDQNYFVVGKLKIRKVAYPEWEEEEYYLNGQRLRYQPSSWGKIDTQGNELFHISRGEPEDLSQNSGFIGFYADDVLKRPWADKVFEAEIEEKDANGNIYTARVKRAHIRGQTVSREVDPRTGKYFHPQEFAGISPWRSGTL